MGWLFVFGFMFALMLVSAFDILAVPLREKITVARKLEHVPCALSKH